MKFSRILSFAVGLFLLTMNSSIAQFNTDLVSVQLNKNSIESVPGKEFEIELTAIIKHGFHINSNKPNDEFLIPVTVTSGNKLFPVEKIEYPVPEELNLPVSIKPVSAYEGKIKIGLKFRVTQNIAAGIYKIPVEFNYQACNDRSCFPPGTVTNELTVNIIANAIKAEEKKEAPAQPEIKKNSIIELKEISIDSAESKPESTNSKAARSDKKEDDPLQEPAAVLEASSEENISIFLALLFAFFGGIILNLMPCVLPVLSLKILGIVEQAGEAPKEKLKHGLIFTLGVLVSFWILAGLLLVLRAGGEQLGWGFQLQSPGFVIVLSIFLFLFGLSMFGVFEIGVGLTAVGQNTKSKSAYMGSFTSGVLATVVATPCTAPFMGSALGFALSQPAYVSLLVFTFLGLGMAAPYLVLTTTPKLLKVIPKPGAWMETMKQFMGFLLMATVLWLLWVLSLQTGAEGVIILLGSLIIISISGWIYGRWGNIAKETKVRRTAQVFAAIILIGALFFSLKNIEAKTSDITDIHIQGLIEWEAFSPELVAKLRDENKPVFIDFTAAWCLS